MQEALGDSGRETVLATDVRRHLIDISRFSEKMTVREARYPLRAMVDRLDPLVIEEWVGAARTALAYVTEILQISGQHQTDAQRIAQKLVFRYSMHSFALQGDQLTRMGLPIRSPEEYAEEWRVMRYWSGRYLLARAQSYHIGEGVRDIPLPFNSGCSHTQSDFDRSCW